MGALSCQLLLQCRILFQDRPDHLRPFGRNGFGQFRILQGKYLRGQIGRVFCSRLTDGDSTDRDPPRHLHGCQQCINAA